MQIKKGAYRLVIFTSKRVYKFPTLRYFWGVAKSVPRMLKNGDGQFVGKELLWGWKNFLRGITENRSEYRCWRRMQKPFMAKVLWGCGFMNIQERIYGQVPTHDELKSYFSRLPEPVQNDLRQVEPHCIEPENFVITKNGLILIDYDDGNGPHADKYPFTVFLERWHSQLEQVFLPKV